MPSTRRAILGSLGAGLVGVAGCLGGTGTPPETTDPTSPSTETAHLPACSTPPDFADPRDPPPETTDDTPAQGTSSTGFDLSVHHVGPLKAGETRTVALRISRLDGGDCAEVVFQRTYRLAPGEAVEFHDPIAAAGTHRAEAHLQSGSSDAVEIETSEGGIPDSTGYQIQIRDGEVTITQVVV